MKDDTPEMIEENEGWSQFDAEAAYADGMFCSSLGDVEGTISALERSLEFMPDYAPAILGMGSVEYQRKREAKGRKLFHSLLSLPDDTAVVQRAGRRPRYEARRLTLRNRNHMNSTSRRFETT